MVRSSLAKPIAGRFTRAAPAAQEGASSDGTEASEARFERTEHHGENSMNHRDYELPLLITLDNVSKKHAPGSQTASTALAHPPG